MKKKISSPKSASLSKINVAHSPFILLLLKIISPLTCRTFRVKNHFSCMTSALSNSSTFHQKLLSVQNKNEPIVRNDPIEGQRDSTAERVFPLYAANPSLIFSVLYGRQAHQEGFLSTESWLGITTTTGCCSKLKPKK